MIRKYHNHKLQTNPRHREEEPHNINSNKASERQLKQSNQLYLDRQDECKIRKDTKNAYKNKDQIRNPVYFGVYSLTTVERVYIITGCNRIHLCYHIGHKCFRDIEKDGFHLLLLVIKVYRFY